METSTYIYEERVAYAKEKADEENNRKIDELKEKYGDEYDDITKYPRIPTLDSINDTIKRLIDPTAVVESGEHALALARNFLKSVAIITDGGWIRYKDAPLFSLQDIKNEAKRRKMENIRKRNICVKEHNNKEGV